MGNTNDLSSTSIFYANTCAFRKVIMPIKELFSHLKKSVYVWYVCHELGSCLMNSPAAGWLLAGRGWLQSGSE